MIDSSSEIQSGHRHWHWWRYATLALLVLLALAPCDVPVARLCYSAAPPRAVIKALEIVGNVGGNGISVFLILIVLVAFSQTKIARLPLLISMSLGAGLLDDIVKLCVGRARPRLMDLSTATFSSTFYGLFPPFTVKSGLQSFPSGHAATSFGFAFALGLLYPRGRRYFIAVAVIVAITRVILHAHFPTDIAAGAMLGGTWAYVCYAGFAAPAFAWCEQTIENSIAKRKTERQGILAVPRETGKSRPALQNSLKGKSDKRDAA
jgi:membrane-associated phospholipid phosphatase